MPIQEVKRQIAHLVDRSFVEIVLTGIALGTYGTDLGLDDGLGDLLESVATLKGLQRLRLGSVEPWAISDRLLSIVAGSENICPHLHIPLQSADDSVLKRMNRRYSTADINRIFDKAYALRNDWGFGTDIIVGFPGETSADFNRTRQFLSDSPLSYLHVFPYSSRPETPATKLPDQVPAEEKQERIRMLRDLDSRMRHRFRIRNLNTCHMVLFENRRINGFLAGHSANYLDVYAIAGDELAGEIRHVNLTDLHPLGVKGEIVHGRQN